MGQPNGQTLSTTLRDYAYNVEKKVVKQTQDVKELDSTMESLKKENKEL